VVQTWGLDVKGLTQWTCKLSTWTLFTVSDYTVWLIIGVTVERYVVVCHALSARVVCRRRRSLTVIALLFAFFLRLRSHDGMEGAPTFAIVEGIGIFWHMVDLLWIVLFSLFYLAV